LFLRAHMRLRSKVPHLTTISVIARPP
jgi:hypothetical protein